MIGEKCYNEEKKNFSIMQINIMFICMIFAGVSVEDISYSSSSRYTSQVLLGAVSQAINKAR